MPHLLLYVTNKYSTDFEVYASDLQEHLEEMFPWYYMYSDMLIMVNSSTTH